MITPRLVFFASPLAFFPQSYMQRVRLPKESALPVTPEPPSEAVISEIIEMALSDFTSFDNIRSLHGVSPDEVKALMRKTLKPGSYRAWRRRVRAFGDRRENYK